jgi:spermidine synthase
MALTYDVVWQGSTRLASYRIVDQIYSGRPARVLYSGDSLAAQSGVARDDKPELLFDYNQRLLELALASKAERILLLGGGAYTLPMALLAHLPSASVDVVELDPELASLAKRYFGLEPSKRLRIIHEDASDFIASTITKYDISLVDIFNQAEVPESLATPEAASNLRQLLTPSGLLAQNAIGAYQNTEGQASPIIASLLASYRSAFPAVAASAADPSLPLWQSQNLILLASATRQIIDALPVPLLPQ